jgi:cytochrome bd-type quinol oxidase subunit 2
MAMINCPECGKEISDKAKACIHCGCPINEEPEASSKDIEKALNKVDYKKRTLVAAILSIIALVFSVTTVGVSSFIYKTETGLNNFFDNKIIYLILAISVLQTVFSLLVHLKSKKLFRILSIVSSVLVIGIFVSFAVYLFGISEELVCASVFTLIPIILFIISGAINLLGIKDSK